MVGCPLLALIGAAETEPTWMGLDHDPRSMKSYALPKFGSTMPRDLRPAPVTGPGRCSVREDAPVWATCTVSPLFSLWLQQHKFDS